MTGVLEFIARYHPEAVIPLADAGAGLWGWLVIDSTRRGPAFGGIRCFPYPDEQAALRDALRLARLMTLKTTLADLPCGGGKIVFRRHAGLKKADALYRIADILNRLQGKYFAGPDVGITEDDLKILSHRTVHVGCGVSTGRSYSDWTALGVLEALDAAVNRFREHHSLPEKPTVCIQGVGQVGASIARILLKRGWPLYLCDIDERALQPFSQEDNVRFIEPDELFNLKTDILIPCAVGPLITGTKVDIIQTRIICGSANGIVDSPETAERLHQRGVLFVPDFISSAGAVIAGALFTLNKAGEKTIEEAVRRIGLRTEEVITRAEHTNVSPYRIALRMAGMDEPLSGFEEDHGLPYES